MTIGVKVQIYDGRHALYVTKLGKGTARTLNEFLSLSWSILPLTRVRMVGVPLTGERMARMPLTGARRPLNNERGPLQMGLPVQKSSPLLSIIIPTSASPLIPTSTSPHTNTPSLIPS